MAKGDKKPVVMEADRAVPGGVATLGDDGKLAEAQRPDASGLKTADGSTVEAALANRVQFDAPQSLTPTQMAQAQSNIGVTWPCNPNLLDNWYFADPINQRGQTVYTGRGYTVDRWKMFADNASVSITEGALQIVSPAGGNAGELVQIMEGKSIKGKRATLSAMVNGAVVSASGFFPSENGSATALYDDGNVALIARVLDTGYPSFDVWVYSGKTVNIQAVKLEYGSQQTLARQENGTWVLNEIQDYGEQLARCQRYFQLYSSAEKRPAKAVDCRPTMRTDPAQSTIVVNSTTYYYNTADL